MSSDGGSEAVLKFWLHLVLGCPNWHKEKSLLLLLDTLCMAAFSRSNWSEIVQETLLEAYQVSCSEGWSLEPCGFIGAVKR